ncbi:MAG: peptide chain release factor N(5)-glutamine methyltransferase [Thermoleophilia bacterium]
MSDSAPAIETIATLLSKSTLYLKEKGSPTPRLDAEVLLAEVLHATRVDLYINLKQPLIKEEVDAYRELIRRRGLGEPVAYITGRAFFRTLTLSVSPAVLVPRPETEHVVEAAIRFLMEGEWGPRRPQVLDVGTGSGAIAIALAVSYPDIRVTAIDASDAALRLAGENARVADASDEIEFTRSDLFDDLDPTQTFDLIVSNPPYISAAEWPTLPVDVREFEPRQAFWGGEDGLDFYRRLAVEAPQFLKPRGCLIMEIGHTQSDAVKELLAETGHFGTVTVEKDYAGHDRVVIAMRGDI